MIARFRPESAYGYFMVFRPTAGRLTCVFLAVFYSLLKLCLYRYFLNFHFGRIQFIFLKFSAKKKKCIFNLVRKKIPISTLKTHFYINCMISSN